MHVAIRVNDSVWSIASWQAEGLLQNLDENVNKCMSMCLVGVTVIAHCRLMCSVGYGMNSSWEMCTCKWSFVSRSQNWSIASWQAEGLLQNLDENVNKLVSMCQIGVTVVANC